MFAEDILDFLKQAVHFMDENADDNESGVLNALSEVRDVENSDTQFDIYFEARKHGFRISVEKI